MSAIRSQFGNRMQGAGRWTPSGAGYASSVGHLASSIQHPASPQIRANGVLSVGMTVENIDRSVAFYRNLLDFEQVSESELCGPEYERLTGVPAARARVARMQLGDETLVLTEFIAPHGRRMPADSRSNDRWFQHVAIIVRDMDVAYARLKRFGVNHASPAPQRLPDWNANAAGICAFYFRDPDGHFLEILQFPPDKGEAKWHGRTDRQFLGIDHTAIVVRSTDQSLSFYRDRLGMNIVGTSENYGPEQERLNDVPGARLRITTLRAAHGPGVELLEYLSPRDGRPRPADARTNDHIHWQTTIAVAGKQQRSALVRDPDGHVIELTGQHSKE